MQLRVKICGITKPEQGRTIAQLGATALGFICVPHTPRYVSIAQIQAVVADLPINPELGSIPDRIGVFVDASLPTICQPVLAAGLNGVQLHGSESPAFCQQLRQELPGVEIIKAFRLKTPDHSLTQISDYQNCVDTLLLDAYHPQQYGGTGQALDWQQLQPLQPDFPWFLAGGLNPDNIVKALDCLQPTGIDVSSGVERSPGDKDVVKVVQLFERLRSRSFHR
jgi:phosphoribosylanthranilate isomerase